MLELDPIKKAEALDEFWRHNDQTERLKTAVDLALSDLRKHGDINRHSLSCRNSGFILAADACCLESLCRLEAFCGGFGRKQGPAVLAKLG